MLVDVGCGIGRFLEYAGDLTENYIGVDVVRHPGLSEDAAFYRADLDRESIPVPPASADIVATLETIEHLESPRLFFGELVRILKPGGWLVLSTPNQLSVLSLLCLIVRGRFVAFQDAYYPVHRTALLPVDLERIAGEFGLAEIALGFSCAGRIPLTGAHYPRDAVADVSPGVVRQRVARRAQACVSSPSGCRVSSSAIRRLPFGRYQLANALARFAGPPFRAQLPGDLGRLSFVCDLRDTIAREVCFTGRYEPQETQLAQGLLGPGMVVVDVGANWGYFTLVCAHLVADRGRVIALEPHPRLAAMLADNVRENRLSQVELFIASRPVRAPQRRRLSASTSATATGACRGPRRTPRRRTSSRRRSRSMPSSTSAMSAASISSRSTSREPKADAIRGMTDGLAHHRYRYALVECHPHELARMGTSLAACLSPFRTAPAIAAGTSITRRRCTAARRQVPCPWPNCSRPSMNASSRPIDWPHLLWVAPGEALPA